MGLSTRAYNAITQDWSRQWGITVQQARRTMTIADLTEYSTARLLQLRLFGFGCLDEVRDALALLGLELRGDAAVSGAGLR